MNTTANASAAIIRAIVDVGNATTINGTHELRALSTTSPGAVGNAPLKVDEKTWVEALKPLWIYLGVQAVIGLIGVEWALWKFRRYMEVDEERDCNFPAFRRLDAHKFARWKFYPGALLMMPTRFVLMILEGLFCVIGLQ